MKRILSTKYAPAAFNFGLLVLRVATGLLMASHGYQKLIHFSQMRGTFMNFLGLGSSVSLSLDIFAEFFCAIFLIIGLFSQTCSNTYYDSDGRGFIKSTSLGYFR